MEFNFITLFPSLIEGYFSDSILKRAIQKELIEINFYNPRDYTTNRYKKVDSPKVGGGAGMLMDIEPVERAILDNRLEQKSKIIFLTPVAKPFRQVDAKRLAKESSITFVCGRYEGFDERLIELYANEVFSIGDYILTGGELGALVMSDAISRNIEGVLGNRDSLVEESFENNLLEAPSFSKPKKHKEISIISEFSKGNHNKIASIKDWLSLYKTKYFRPDIYQKIKAEYHEK
ncbi:MAG: tRNA (guanosine(37)-N1)-methyltransferase TrmD [Epsilonproteobacteria bacterium]|nr:tRNA (guanosine(37)-N1)-methyltransferase TrmD [Campylobacterota bacterium]